MFRSTRWTLDTCGCELEYSYDSEMTPDNLVRTPLPHSERHPIRVCAEHVQYFTGAEPHNELFEKLDNESSFRQGLRSSLLESLPETEKVDILNEHGEKVGEGFKIEPTLTYDSERNLIVSHPSLDNTVVKEATAQTLVTRNPELENTFKIV